MKNSLIITVFILFLAMPAMAEEAHVIKVIDGDSMRIELRGIQVDLRLLGVDAPEYNQPGGAEATAFVKAWVEQGGTIDLEYDHNRYGKYGRLLAWVWRGGHLLQEDMVRAGHAQVKRITEKDKHYQRLMAAKDDSR